MTTRRPTTGTWQQRQQTASRRYWDQWFFDMLRTGTCSSQAHKYTSTQRRQNATEWCHRCGGDGALAAVRSTMLHGVSLHRHFCYHHLQMSSLLRMQNHVSSHAERVSPSYSDCTKVHRTQILKGQPWTRPNEVGRLEDLDVQYTVSYGRTSPSL